MLFIVLKSIKTFFTVIDGERRWGNGERRSVTVAKNGNGTVMGQ